MSSRVLLPGYEEASSRETAAIISAALLIVSVFGFTVSAGFGSGVAVVASETKIIKSGIFGQKIIFSDLDFKQGLAITDFDKIEITDVPDSNEGYSLSRKYLFNRRRIKKMFIMSSRI